MNTKFLVKLARCTRAAEYVQRIDRSPVQTTPKRNLALVMGRLTAEDVVSSLGNSRCTPELVPVQVTVKHGLIPDSMCARLQASAIESNLRQMKRRCWR